MALVSEDFGALREWKRQVGRLHHNNGPEDFGGVQGLSVVTTLALEDEASGGTWHCRTQSS